MPIAALFRPLFDIAREMGIDRAPVLAPLHLTEEYIHQPDARLTHEQGRALAREMTRLTGKIELGLLIAERFQLSDLDLLGYIVRSAETLYSALEAVARYGRLLGDTAAFRFERKGGSIVLSFSLADGYAFEPTSADYLTGVVMRCVRELSGGSVVPLEVHLPRRPPRCAGFYRRWFGVPVFFGAECARLVYSEQALSAAPAERDARLTQLLEQRADSILASLPKTNDVLDRVRTEIARSLAGGSVSLPRVARRCGLSDRTLRRKLQLTGVQFRRLVEDIRRERALALINGGQESVATIALELGYRDPISFSRAFRRWTGATPQHYLEHRRESRTAHAQARS